MNLEDRLDCPIPNSVSHIKKRLRHWENSKEWLHYDEIGKQRLLDFFEGRLDNIFGITNKEKYLEWQKLFVMDNRID